MCVDCDNHPLPLPAREVCTACQIVGNQVETPAWDSCGSLRCRELFVVLGFGFGGRFGFGGGFLGYCGEGCLDLF